MLFLIILTEKLLLSRQASFLKLDIEQSITSLVFT